MCSRKGRSWEVRGSRTLGGKKIERKRNVKLKKKEKKGDTKEEKQKGRETKGEGLWQGVVACRFFHFSKFF